MTRTDRMIGASIEPMPVRRPEGLELRARRIADAGSPAPQILSPKEIREAVYQAALVELRAAVEEAQKKAT